MKKRHVVFTYSDERLRGTLDDHATTRDFIKKLPMTVTMHDLYHREKYVKINGLTVDHPNVSHFNKGDISFWIPGNVFVIYYKGNQEPLNGLMKMGRILDGIEKLEKYPGDIEVTIDTE